jgi:SAM-dependent methyltransferase
VLVTSRSYDEYAAFFDLDAEALAGKRVLDCSAGASSFVARLSRQGVNAVAVDPAYDLPRDRLADVAAAGLRDGSAIAADHPGRFTWRWYGSVEAREKMRARALAEFIVDLGEHPERYVAASLPTLPFADDAFDLAVCSHLFFTWADQLGYDWHLASLRELTRVAGEVRAFPTVLQGAGDPVPFWDELMAQLRADGLAVQLRAVGYEFQVGATSMLVVGRGPAVT